MIRDLTAGVLALMGQTLAVYSAQCRYGRTCALRYSNVPFAQIRRKRNGGGRGADANMFRFHLLLTGLAPKTRIMSLVLGDSERCGQDHASPQGRGSPGGGSNFKAEGNRGSRDETKRKRSERTGRQGGFVYASFWRGGISSVVSGAKDSSER